MSLEKLVSAFGQQAVMILGLIAAQVILAVAVAIKDKSFEWRKLADFFGTIVVPKLLGWLACAILAQFVLVDYLPENLKVLGPGIELVAFGAVVLSLAGAILSNLQALDILPQNVSNALTMIGVPGKKVDK